MASWIVVARLSLIVLAFLFLANQAGAQSEHKSEAAPLELRKKIERELPKGDVHAYQISLEAGQLFEATVNQRGTDVVIETFGPDHQKIAEFDSPNGYEGPEPVAISAKISGVYRLELRANPDSTQWGRYELVANELLSAAEYAARLAKEKATTEMVRSWLATNAIRLETVEAGHGFADLQPLKQIIGNARIVSLGEATHGTREFFQMKHRMLEFLVSEMGFNLFGIEATMPESFDINDYVLNGHGDPAKALAGIYFWTWDTQEVLDMITWMRAYNAEPAHRTKVKFYGFDMQSPTRAAKVMLSYLHKVDPQTAANAEKNLQVLMNPYTAARFFVMSKEVKGAAAEASRAALANFDSRKADYIKRSNAGEWEIARQHAQVLAQAIETYSVALPEGSAVRDRAMAENVRWILNHEGPEAKIVLWAHNYHVSAANVEKPTAMGEHLRTTFGKQMVVFGFAFNQGGFQAVEMPFGYARGLRSFVVGPAREDSYDAMLASTGLRLAAIDLHKAVDQSEVATWMNTPRATRSFGAGYSEQAAAGFFSNEVMPKLYDALFFIETTSSARAVNEADKPPPYAKLAAPANLDFETSEVGKPPDNWIASHKLLRYDFQVSTVAGDCFTGQRCAVIARAKGKHYGEIAGQLVQRIDATAYRGKKIKLRAAVRTDLKGPDDNAWLRLGVQKKSSGLEPYLFDSLDRYPIKSGRWQTYEIVAEVPENADEINYGLFMIGDGKAWIDSLSIEVLDK